MDASPEPNPALGGSPSPAHPARAGERGTPARSRGAARPPGGGAPRVPPVDLPWRRRLLREAGFPPPLADALAADPRRDLHALIELAERGCPPGLAVRITAPLADRGPERP